jgi:hypothetical protein
VVGFLRVNAEEEVNALYRFDSGIRLREIGHRH